VGSRRPGPRCRSGAVADSLLGVIRIDPRTLIAYHRDVSGFDYQFEWSATKARLNVEKHGVAFLIAIASIQDPLARTIFDGRGDEPRWVTTGRDPMDPSWWSFTHGGILVRTALWCVLSRPAKPPETNTEITRKDDDSRRRHEGRIRFFQR
jgi:uncharacterized DUF497 family protein